MSLSVNPFSDTTVDNLKTDNSILRNRDLTNHDTAEITGAQLSMRQKSTKHRSQWQMEKVHRTNKYIYKKIRSLDKFNQITNLSDDKAVTDSIEVHSMQQLSLVELHRQGGHLDSQPVQAVASSMAQATAEQPGRRTSRSKSGTRKHAKNCTRAKKYLTKKMQNLHAAELAAFTSKDEVWVDGKGEMETIRLPEQMILVDRTRSQRRDVRQFNFLNQCSTGGTKCEGTRFDF